MFQGIRYVYAVYEEGSFSRAAEKLFISQPSLSANVRREEEAVGFPIFDRGTKPLRLTECGREYIRAAEQILSVNRQFGVYLSDLEGLKSGSLTIGGSNLFASFVLPELLSAFSRKYPGIRITLEEGSSRELEHMLNAGKLDLLLDNAKLDKAVYDRYIFREEYLLLAVPAEFPVNDSLSAYQVPLSAVMDGSFLSETLPPVPLEAFSETPFIFMKPDNDTGERAAAICRENGFTPRILFELDQQMTCYNITSSGMGASFISDTLIRSVPFHEHIQYYRLSGKNSRRHLSFYWKRGSYRSLAMREFLAGLGKED